MKTKHIIQLFIGIFLFYAGNPLVWAQRDMSREIIVYFTSGVERGAFSKEKTKRFIIIQ